MPQKAQLLKTHSKTLQNVHRNAGKTNAVQPYAECEGQMAMVWRAKLAKAG